MTLGVKMLRRGRRWCICMAPGFPRSYRDTQACWHNDRGRQGSNGRRRLRRERGRG